MSDAPKIRPALSPEEWKSRVAERVTAAGHPYAITARDGHLELHGITGARPIPEELRFPVAAFCLEGQSFGFSREDVEDELLAYRHTVMLADTVGRELDGVDLREKAARHMRRALRIAALLPPDVAAEETMASANDGAGQEMADG